MGAGQYIGSIKAAQDSKPEPMQTEPETGKKQVEDRKSYWDQKDVKISRMNVLGTPSRFWRLPGQRVLL